MKRLLIVAALLGAFLAPAAAQVNVVPQTGLTVGYVPKATYSSSFFGLVPVVTIGTDQICITGSASKTVRLQRITVYGTTTTGAQVVPLNLVRRASADTGGTAATTTANPGVTTQITRRDTSVAGAATATLVSYTAAPTIVDAAPVYIDSQLMAMPLGLVSTQPPGQVDFYFGRDIENNLAAPTLRGVANQICVNNGTALTNASVWNGSIVWTEE